MALGPGKYDDLSPGLAEAALAVIVANDAAETPEDMLKVIDAIDVLRVALENLQDYLSEVDAHRLVEIKNAYRSWETCRVELDVPFLLRLLDGAHVRAAGFEREIDKGRNLYVQTLDAVEKALQERDALRAALDLREDGARGEVWVIWSEEHGRWWGPGRSGYVNQLADAGRYSATDAIEIERSGNYPTRPPEFREISIPDPLPAFQRSRVQEFADADFRLRNRPKT